MKKAAIVTFAIGDMKAAYEKMFIPSIKAYAAKWNFDFYCIDSLLEKSTVTSKTDFGKLICMQKLLIAKQSWAQDYAYIIYIDADILINYEKAPNILEGIPYGKIAAIDERNIWGNTDNAKAFFSSCSPFPTADDYYKFLKFPKSFTKQFNAGLFVFQPAVHASFFQEVYDKYLPKILAGEDIDGDQGPLNFEGNTRDLFHCLDDRFNRVWILTYTLFYSFLNPIHHKDILKHALKKIFDASYCIHFSGKFGWNLLE